MHATSVVIICPEPKVLAHPELQLRLRDRRRPRRSVASEQAQPKIRSNLTKYGLHKGFQ